MKITTPLLALVGALAVAAPQVAAAAPAHNGQSAHLTAKTEKQKEQEAKERRNRVEERKDNRRDARERVEERKDNRRDARERVEERKDDRRDARERVEERKDDRREARERVDDRRQVALREYRSNVRERQREKFVRYYRSAYDRNSCPPGLRREYGGCYPSGWNHRREWREGYALPSTVIYYDLPSSIYGYVEPAPYGYRYVQVGNDILLIDIATRLVVDAFAIY